jgi:hypothetical protein
MFKRLTGNNLVLKKINAFPFLGITADYWEEEPG